MENSLVVLHLKQTQYMIYDISKLQ